jgi:hypothetical protein
MDHPTSRWAHQLGLPDPGVPAQAVLDADPAALDRLAASCERVAHNLEVGHDLIRQALAMLEQAWSAPEAVAAVTGVGMHFRTVAAIGRQAAHSIRTYASGIPAARTAVHEAYRTADEAIVDQGLIPDPPVLPPAHYEAILGLRAYVVTSLNTRVSPISARLDQAAAALASDIGPDPRDGLPQPSRRGFGPAPLIGAADGDARNRAKLARDLASTSPGRHAFAVSVQRALQHAAGAGGIVQLLHYDPSNPARQGGVAISIGDVATADSVAVLVPGVGNSPSDASGALDLASDLTHATEQAAPGTSAATVVYLDYDIPLSWPDDAMVPPGLGAILPDLMDTASATNDLESVAGGQRLAGFVQQLRADMDPTAGLALIGHSYGSTVVSRAATVLGPDAGIDDIVLLGSPGAGIGPRTAADYRAVPADHVYALGFPLDPVTSPGLDLAASLINVLPPTPGGPFGPDPADGFGAQVIEAPSSAPVNRHSPWFLSLATGGMSGVLAHAGAGPVANLNQHELSNYLSGTALGAVAAVAAGRYAKVPVKTDR